MAILAPATTHVIASVKGANEARLVGLKSIAYNQNTFQGLTSVGPGLQYPGVPGTDTYIFLRDLVYMAETYPGFFTASYLRPALDKWVTSIGGDPTGPNHPAEYLTASGFVYRPGAGGGSYLPTLDNGPFMVLLGCLIYERGDTTVYNTYKTQFAQVLAAAPRGVSGCIYSDPLNQSCGWGFEDGQDSSNKGDLGMTTAYHILAYQKLASMATAEGDTAAAATYTGLANGLITALNATLRKPNDFYMPCTNEPLKDHVMLTAMVCCFGWDTPTNLTASANALLTEYNAVGSLFSSGLTGGKGGNIAQRGGIRHLVYPQYWDVGSTPNVYQNGGAWTGPWTGWVACALDRVSHAAAQELLQSATEELLRQHRCLGFTPWEWSYYSGVGAVASNAGGGFLPYVSDDAAAQEIALAGTMGASAFLDLLGGTPAARYSLSTSTPATVTVAIDSAAYVNTVFDTIPAANTLGGYSTPTSVSLSNATAVTSAYINNGSSVVQPPLAANGGRIRATVTGGSSVSNIVVRAERALVTPTFQTFVPPGPSTVIWDDFSTDKLGTDYSVGGPWTVSGGTLHYAGTTDGDYAVNTNHGTFTDGTFTLMIYSPLTEKLPTFFMRASADGLNGILLMCASGAIAFLERTGGFSSFITNKTIPITANTWHTLVINLSGGVIDVTVDNVNYGTFNTSIVSAGYMGAFVGVAVPGAEEIQFDNLGQETVVGVTNVVPANLVVTSPTTGWAPGDVITESTNLTLRDAFGTPVSTWTSGNFQFVYPPDPTPPPPPPPPTPPTQEPINVGSTNLAAFDLLMRNIHPSFRSKEGWGALVSAIATGDQVVFDNNSSIFDQLFVSSASGQYLDIRAADLGIIRPPYLNINDALFRELTIALSNKKLITEAVGEVLRVFYGDVATRANITSAVGPFSLQEGRTLRLSVTGHEAIITFHAVDFDDIGVARADEVANVITRDLKILGVGAYAVAIDNAVRIYTSAIGITTYIAVTGGTSQQEFVFPLQNLFSTQLSVWNATTIGVNQYRFSYDDAATIIAGGAFPTGFTNMRAGDYLVDNGEFFVTKVVYNIDPNTGMNVSYFEFTSAIPVSFGNQIPATSFFRPQKYRVTDNLLPSYIVQYGNSGADIVLPVTTQAVNRGPTTAMYPQSNTEITAMLSYTGGIFSITTDAPHGLSNNAWVQLIGDDRGYLSFTVGEEIPRVGYGIPSKLLGEFFQVTVTGPSTFEIIVDDWPAGLPDLTFYLTVLKVGAVSSPSNGPYIYDPDAGLAITAIETSITSSLPKYGSVSELPVASTVGFSADGGWLVIGYATQYETAPIRYYGIKDSTNLIIDRYLFAQDIPASTSVTVLFQREPWVPVAGRFGSTYITASNAGITAVQQVLKTVVAAGVGVRNILIYPGDEGLAGFQKAVSDKYVVWGSDEPDTDWQAALNG